MEYTVRHFNSSTESVKINTHTDFDEAVKDLSRTLTDQQSGTSTLYKEGDPIASRNWNQTTINWWEK